MAVLEISKKHLDPHNPLRKRSADNALLKEIAWFKDAQGDTIGIIVKSKHHENFSALSFTSSD